MPTVYLVKQGAKVRIQNRRFCVEYDDQVISSLPLHHVSQVIIFGNIGLTTPAISLLLRKNVEVLFLTRRGRYKGRLGSMVTPHVPLRKAQYRLQEDKDFTLLLAKTLVRAKISHQRTLLRRNQQEEPDNDYDKVLETLTKSLENLERKNNLHSLRGVEGTAAAVYFRGLRSLFTEEWGFQKRNRRPPRDPVNVLLSFGYTLITQVANAAVRSSGLDVYAGFLHAVDYNRPSLGLDLVEEFRPVVDGLVLWCCRSGYLTPDHFEAGTGKRPVLLDQEGQKKFLSAFEKRMKKRFTHPIRQQRLSIRQCMFEQATQLADCVREGNSNYQPMGFR